MDKSQNTRSLRSKESQQTIRRLMTYFRKDRVPFFFAIFCTAASTIFDIITPWLIGRAISSLFVSFTQNQPIDMAYLQRLTVILVILYLVSSSFLLIRGRLLSSITTNLLFRLRSDLSEKIRRLPLSYLDTQKVGDLLSRMTNDMESIGNNLRQNIAQIISGFVTIVGVIIMMFFISPQLTIVSLITLPVSILATTFLAKRSQSYYRQKSKTLGEIDGYMEEIFSGQEVVKAYTFEDQAMVEFQEINHALYDASYRAQFISGIIMPTTNFISKIGYVFVTALGGVYVIRGIISIGDIQAIIQYFRKLNQPINSMAEVVASLQSAVAAARRVFTILDAEEELPVLDGKTDINFNGDIEFHNVSFGYVEDQRVIKDFNLKVESGETIAIVGPTGAGKTTLINLLLRFYDVTEGAITIDGVDIRNIPRETLRNAFGMVLQDAWLFQDSIYNNLAYGNPDATATEIEKAAQATYIDNFIKTLPEGYDTIISEGATELSAGQKQLLTITRALVSDPEILILDEATSSVDTRTERLIQVAMDRLMKGRTNFVIAHRLSTIENADSILVLVDGNIVEQGSHEELMALRGEYYALYRSQFENEAI